MSRLAPRVAGRRVMRLAQEFSDGLLAEEEATFRRIDAALRNAAPDGRTTLTRALKKKTPAQVPSDRPVMDALLGVWDTATAAAHPRVLDLGETATRRALASIRAELGICEQTKAGAYQGVAERAVQVAEVGRDGILADEETMWVGVVATSRLWLETAIRQQCGKAEGLEDLSLRLFSEKPARLRGFGGRGVLWQAGSDLHAAARQVAISSSNRIRTMAMVAFNDQCVRVDRARR